MKYTNIDTGKSQKFKYRSKFCQKPPSYEHKIGELKETIQKFEHHVKTMPKEKRREIYKLNHLITDLKEELHDLEIKSEISAILMDGASQCQGTDDDGNGTGNKKAA